MKHEEDRITDESSCQPEEPNEGDPTPEPDPPTGGGGSDNEQGGDPYTLSD